MTTDNERLAQECEREASISRGLQYITAADLLQRAANALRSVPAQGMVMVPRDVLHRMQNECWDVISFQVAIHNLLTASQEKPE